MEEAWRRRQRERIGSSGLLRRLAQDAAAPPRRKKKRFQATFWFSPFPDRHARPKHGGYGLSGFALLLPATAFTPLRISAPERFPRLPYPEPALRNGVSLAPAAVPFRAPPRGVTAPRLLLQPNPESRLPARSVRHSRPRSAFALLARGRSMSRSRCRTPFRNSPAALQLSLTLGTHPSGSTCLLTPA